jgi:hypothetical protein
LVLRPPVEFTTGTGGSSTPGTGAEEHPVNPKAFALLLRGAGLPALSRARRRGDPHFPASSVVSVQSVVVVVPIKNCFGVDWTLLGAGAEQGCSHPRYS